MFFKKNYPFLEFQVFVKIGQRLHALFMAKTLWYIESNMKDVEKKWFKTKVKR
jgi:hypothetical protein